jgi:hypothetical protein
MARALRQNQEFSRQPQDFLKGFPPRLCQTGDQPRDPLPAAATVPRAKSMNEAENQRGRAFV